MSIQGMKRAKALFARWHERMLVRRAAGICRGTSDFRASPGAVAVSSAPGTIARLFEDHQGRPTHKWTHFPGLYDRYFSGLRGKPVRLLEIGVSTGGSLEIWRRYFGPDATIVGLDLNPATRDNVDLPNRVYIGHQADPALLGTAIAENGPFDIVIDDGSHIAADQLATLRTLWPALVDGGIYVVEDTMTSYLPGLYRGGYRRRGTAIDVAQDLTDDLHQWAHGRPARIGLADLAAVNVHPTIIFLEKAAMPEPRHTRYGMASCG